MAPPDFVPAPPPDFVPGPLDFVPAPPDLVPVPPDFVAVLRVEAARVVRVVFAAAPFSDEPAVSDLRARVVRFGAASAVLVAAVARFGAALAAVASDLLAAVLRGAAGFEVADAARERVVFGSADFVSAVLLRAAVRFGLAAADSPDEPPADAVLRDVVRRAGLESALPLLADLVVARAAIACARRFAGVSSVMCPILLCVF